MTLKRKQLGSSGEDRALQYLEQKGYFLLGQNVRLNFGEIDLLMKDGATIVVVEVKTKSNAKFGLPQEEVDFRKKEKLILLARALMQKFPHNKIRIDVVAIDESTKKLDHIISAVEE